MVPGQFTLPLLGRARFGVRLAAMTVETEIAAAACLDCGHLELALADLERIRRAETAGRRAGLRGGLGAPADRGPDAVAAALAATAARRAGTGTRTAPPAPAADPAATAAASVPATEGLAGRPGIGRDSHSFGPGLGLRLGGVEFPTAPRLHGHSDGDVVLHAVADAILGAAGLGDLGRLFPAGPATPAGIDSRRLVEEVLSLAASAGWRPASLDVTIVAGRPRLSGRLEEIADSVTALVGLAPGRVNVKASTGNLAGVEGEGRGISALVVVLLEPVGPRA